MSNVIPFRPSSQHHVGAAFLDDPAPHAHAVQFYDDDEFLFDTVARFLASGLDAGDRMLVIATPAHREGILRRLDRPALAQALVSKRFVFLDARVILNNKLFYSKEKLMQ